MYYLAAKNQPVTLYSNSDSPRLSRNIIPLPSFQGLKFVTEDPEIFLRGRMGNHNGERIDKDETGKRFYLYFYEGIFGLTPDLLPAELVTCCAFELAQYPTYTEIVSAWIEPPENSGVVLTDREEFLQVHMDQLNRLADGIREKFSKAETTKQEVSVQSERKKALNKLAVLWVDYNQNKRQSKFEDMKWFLNEYAGELGLVAVSTSEFKKHLAKAHENKIIDKDERTRKYIPKLGT